MTQTHSRAVQRAGRALTALSLICAAQAALAARPALAAVAAPTAVTFHVTTLTDAHDAHPGDGRCADAAGQCTLRAAVEEADAAPAGARVIISVPAGRYRLTLGTLPVGGGSPVSITIDGAGSGRTVIGGGGSFRVMSVAATATVVLDGLEVTAGDAGPVGYGGGVLSSGTLTLTDVLVAHNRAGAGGGVDNSGGSLVVTGSVIEDNDAAIFGGGGIQNGGLHNKPGSVLVVSSVITGNKTQNEGGGIFSGQNGRPSAAGLAAVAPRPLCPRPRCRPWNAPAAPELTLTVVDSTVSGNRGGNGGGGISAEGPAQLLNSTVNDNSAGGALGGGVFNVGLIRHSTISGNEATSGGAVEVFPSVHVTIIASTLDANHSFSYGGAIDEGGDVTISQSTLAHNIAGGRIYLGSGSAVEVEGGGQLQVSDSTVSHNTTNPPGGGAIDNYGGLTTLSFDTFSGNSGSITGVGYTTATGTILSTTGSKPNCEQPLHETAGYNLATDTSCGLSLPTDLTGVRPELAPLASNGGPTSTQALNPASPAVDAGGLPATSGCPLLDQRGQSRPWGPACDIGAFELHYPQSAATRIP